MRAFIRATFVAAWQKVFVSVARDRVTQVFLFALPLGTTLVVGAASASSSEIHLAVVRPRDAATATALRAAVDEVPTLQVEWVDDRRSAALLLARQQVAATLELAPSEQERGGSEVVQLRVDRGRVDPGLISGPVLAVVSELSARTDGPRLATEVFGGDPSQADERAAAELSRPEPLVDTTDTGPPRALGGFTFAAVGNLVLYAFVATFGTAVALTNERHDGQLERLLAAPVPRSALVSGHLVARVGIGVVQIAFVVAVTSLLFDVEWGSLALVAALSLPFVLLAGSLGLIAATAYRSNEQASVVTGLIAFPAAMLGGCFWSLAIVGPAWRAAGHALPHAWLVDGLLETAGGGGWDDVKGELLVLVMAAAAVVPVTVWFVARSLSTPAPRT